jgi:hypothetical protein
MNESCGVDPDPVWGWRAFHGGPGGEEQVVTPSAVPDEFDLAFEGLYRLAYRVAFRILGDRVSRDGVIQWVRGPYVSSL